MTQDNTQNPLAKYFRQPQAYVKIPSSYGKFCDESAIEYAREDHELAVYPMTAQDEIRFRNPDALLNGEAVLQTIKSCVPEIKNPKKLLKNDIDYLLAIIKNISYDGYDVSCVCPKCKTGNQFELSLDYLIEGTAYLDESYPINMESGLTAFVTPYKYETTLKFLSISFEETKFLRTFSADESVLDDVTKMKNLSKSINKMADLNFDIIADSILSIVNESDDVNVTDRKVIKQFLQNINRADASLIMDEVSRISEIGLLRTTSAVCANCEHEWEADVIFDPVTFFTKS